MLLQWAEPFHLPDHMCPPDRTFLTMWTGRSAADIIGTPGAWSHSDSNVDTGGEREREELSVTSLPNFLNLFLGQKHTVSRYDIDMI